MKKVKIEKSNKECKENRYDKSRWLIFYLEN